MKDMKILIKAGELRMELTLDEYMDLLFPKLKDYIQKERILETGDVISFGADLFLLSENLYTDNRDILIDYMRKKRGEGLS